MSAQDEMTCKELVEVVSDYLEGRLPSNDRRRLEEHLGECIALSTSIRCASRSRRWAS